MEKYDLGEFLFPYKKVRGVYDYLNKLESEDDLLSLFDMITTFIFVGQRPQHIEADINRNLHAFGKEGFFEADLQALLNWSECLCYYNQKLRALMSEEKLAEIKDPEGLRLFKQLIILTTELSAKIKKPSFLSRFRKPEQA